jgi:hypothetical protein
MPFASNTTAVADILFSKQEDGEVRVNLGDALSGDGYASEASMWGPDGFLSMPNDPSSEGACQALYIQDGNVNRVIGARDNRFATKASAMAAGDRLIVSDCDARIMLRKEPNQVALYTVNADDSDAAMMIELNGSTGELQLVVSGASIKMTKDMIQLSVAGTVLELNADNFGVFAKHFACNAGGGNLGVMPPGIPPPVGVSSILAGVTGIAGAPSTKWTVAI